MRRPSAIATRYAQAAFDVARQDNTVEEWSRNLDNVAQVLASPDALPFFRDPNVTREDKLSRLESVFPDVQPHVMNLLRMLATRERLHLVSAIYDAFQKLDRAQRGVLEATVTVARDFDETEQTDIVSRLARVTGKHVEARFDVDPHILGGIVVRIGDRLIDASVAGRLERLRQEMAV